MRAMQRAITVVAITLMMAAAATTGVQSACVPAATSDAVPSNPGLTGAAAAAAAALAPTDPSFIRLGCSEKASVFTQTAPYTGPDAAVNSSSQPSVASWPRVNCPHLAAGLNPFENVFPSVSAESTVTVATGSSLLLRACSLPAASQTSDAWVLGRLVVSSGATLVIDDAPLLLRVREIVVQPGGKLLAGSATCRLYSRIRIIFHGSRATSHLPSSNPSGTSGRPSKGILAAGTIDVHGKLYFPTWTRLARTVGGGSAINDSLVFLQEAANWEVGQEVLITTSILLDCAADYANPFCRPCWNGQGCESVPHQNEIRTIVALGHAPNLPSSSSKRFTALLLDRPLAHSHYAGPEYQSEVALLSRRVEFGAENSNDNFGGHVQVMGPSSEGRISGVRCDGLGQLNEIGRYPLHFHMQGESAGARRSYFQDCSITNSFFRAAVIHGTNHTRLSRNVAYNVRGMAFYLEDGVEEHNLLEYNLAAHVHPIFRPANGGYSQQGETFLAQAGLLIPADTSAAGFYALNAMNAWVGNAASGGWTGFAFPNAPGPMGDYKDSLPADSPYNPERRPLKRFVGNTAHSAGYHWIEHGNCFYVGAKLNYNSNGVMQYNSGRNERESVNPDGSGAIMVFEHSKAWMCNKGIAHWGNTARIENSEMHDVRVSAMLFGEASLVNVLVTGRTPNLRSPYLIAQNNNKMGFQFYDTHVRTILSGVTFRNFSAANKEFAIRYMDHSDHYTPQGINSVRGIKYENVDATARLGIANCGAACGGGHVTMSSRIYSVWDFDGTMSRSSGPSILGSHETWWNHESLGCVYRAELLVWVCPWKERSTVAYIEPGVDGLYDGCDAAITALVDPAEQCTDQYAPYTVGHMSQWGGAAGAAKNLELGAWRGTSGMANTGWYWRVRVPEVGIDGAPSRFTIGEPYQVARGSFVVLAVAYPAAAAFTVYIESLWWKDGSGNYIRFPLAQAGSLSSVLSPREELKPSSQFTCGNDWFSMCTNTGGVGPAWSRDATHLYLRVVNPGCYNKNQRGNCESAAEAFYASGGITVPTVAWGFKYVVEAECAGCAVQKSYGGVTYWTATDSPPATSMATDFGALRSSPPTPASENIAFAQCAAGTGPDAGGGSDAVPSSSGGSGGSGSSGSSSTGGSGRSSTGGAGSSGGSAGSGSSASSGSSGSSSGSGSTGRSGGSSSTGNLGSSGGFGNSSSGGDGGFTGGNIDDHELGATVAHAPHACSIAFVFLCTLLALRA